MWPFRRRNKRGEVMEDGVSEIPYRLVESKVRVRGTLVTSKDPYDGDSSAVEDVHIEMLQTGGDDDATRRLRTGSGTLDVSVSVTADGRLQTVEYKQVGSGSAVMSAGVKLVGFIAGAVISAAAALGRVGALAGEGEPPPPKPRDPREDWGKAQPGTADLLQQNKRLALAAALKLAELRTELVASSDLVNARAISARAQVLSAALDAARAEVGRLEGLYLTWRSSQTSKHSASLECVVEFDKIPVRLAGADLAQPPQAPGKEALGHELWRDFRLILEVTDARRSDDVVASHSPAISNADDEARIVRWRVPRDAELWVWSQPDLASAVALQTRSPVRVSDHRSDSTGMTLREGTFGEHGGAWVFNEDGSPLSVRTNDKSGVAALADAIGAVPEQLAGAVEQAKKLTDTIYGIQDAAAEREKAAAERDLATAKARVELLGVNATAEDAAAVGRAEQAVKLRTATRSLSPATDALDDLKAELERAKTQNDLDSARRSAQVETELEGLKAQVARLEQEALMAKARYKTEHPEAKDE